jgi:hypothetical protein
MEVSDDLHAVAALSHEVDYLAHIWQVTDGSKTLQRTDNQFNPLCRRPANTPGKFVIWWALPAPNSHELSLPSVHNLHMGEQKELYLN